MLLARSCFAVVAVVSCLMLNGCATSRSEIKLNSPVTATSVAPADGKIVSIRSIVDARVFEEAPRDPSTPSLGFGGAKAATDEVRARAIGRKRNTYGKALGDILLDEGQTIDSVVRENLTVALQHAGYRVQEQGAAGSALPIEVRVTKFWAWLQPGFWALTMHAMISTEITVGTIGAPIVIDVHAQEKRQMGTDSAWMEIIDQALGQYRSAATTQTQGRF